MFSEKTLPETFVCQISVFHPDTEQQVGLGEIDLAPKRDDLVRLQRGQHVGEFALGGVDEATNDLRQAVAVDELTLAPTYSVALVERLTGKQSVHELGNLVAVQLKYPALAGLQRRKRLRSDVLPGFVTFRATLIDKASA